MRRYLLTWSVLAGLILAPGLACTNGRSELAEQAQAGGETAQAEAEGTEETAAVPLDTTNDGRSVAQRLQDLSIAANVRLKLAEAAPVNINEISTEVQGGRVVLAGDVASAQVRQQAEQAARQVEGVRQVVNRLNAPDAPAVVETPTTPAPAPPVAEAQPRAQQPPAQPEEKPEPAEEKPAAQYYTVRSGDNLWTIARRNGLSVDQLKRLNDMSSNNLRPGQKLRVK